MHILAFEMRLREPGLALEYKRQHDALWPELVDLFARHGVSDYSIYLAADGVTLFATLRCCEIETMEKIADEPAMRRWWITMKPLMITDASGRPISRPLQRVFYLH